LNLLLLLYFDKIIILKVFFFFKESNKVHLYPHRIAHFRGVKKYGETGKPVIRETMELVLVSVAKKPKPRTLIPVLIFGTQ
jgi:hypothetical protein